MTEISRDIADRIDRVLDFHRGSERSYQSAQGNPKLDWPNQPSPYRIFPDHPKLPLPTRLLDSPSNALLVLSEGLAALPESQLQPPQDLRTLASWLHLAAGRTHERQVAEKKAWLRAVPSAGALYPCEIYVAAFGMADLEPGLYHFSVQEFALRKLREGTETLSTIKRGRPDLEFLKAVPAALLISTIFCRSSWKFRRGGFRMALLDAGHVVQNLVAAANGLGIQTMPRLRVHEASMRELLGLGIDAAFGAAESVQAMVVWADSAAVGSNAVKPPPGMPGAAAAAQALPLIEREPLSPAFLSYGSITAVQEDCVAPGMVLRTIRPPTTGTCAMPPTEPGLEMPPVPSGITGPSLRQVMLGRRSTRVFQRGAAMPRELLLTLNRVAFLGGSFYPILPGDSHVGLVRPFWAIHDVRGIDSGLWYYHPPADRWWLMRRGDFRMESSYLCMEQSLAGDATALCWICADLKTLLSEAGPDAYRLCHLEAGIVAQRIHLSASAMGAGCCGIGSFYDQEARDFIDGPEGSWQPLYAVAVGTAAATQPVNLPAELHPG